MLNQVISLIDKSNNEQRYLRFEEAFKEVSNVYYFTNENISGCLTQLEFKNNESSLTICGSGDQIFNLVYKGNSCIDAFDTNKLAEYFALGIKKAAIKTFTYEEFLSFYNDMIEEDISIEIQYNSFLKLKANMDLKYFDFFNLVFLNSIKKNHKLSVFKILTMNHISCYLATELNDYLKSSTEYDITKEKLESCNINFIQTDLFEIKNKTNLLYDKIFLSNVLDYAYKVYGDFWKYEQIKPFIEEDLLPLLNEEGKLVLAYMFKYYSLVRNVGRSSLFFSSCVKKEDIDCNILNVAMHPLSLNSLESKTVADAVVVIKK